MPNDLNVNASDWLSKRLKSQENVTILSKYAVQSIEGGNMVEGIHLRHLVDGTIKMLSLNGVFIAVGTVPTSQLIEKAGVEVDDRGWVKVDRIQRTNLREIYALDDCTGGGM